jgi:hypothetical protein
MSFQNEEIELLSNPKFYELKNGATEKLKSAMEKIREALLMTIEPQRLIAPSSTDFLKGQIAKGENYEGYPYVMLDFPKQFSKDSIFTFRTMFWYGHDFIFSVILAGELLARYRANLKSNFDALANENFSFGKEDVWDWRKSAQIKFESQNKAAILSLSDSQPFLKLMQRFPPSILSDEENLRRLAVKFYQTVKPIIGK